MGHGAWAETGAAALVAGLVIFGCTDPIPVGTRSSWGPPEELTAKREVRFAVIGDYGRAGPAARDVAARVIAWRPDLVLTTGDNNYPQGAADTIDGNVGRYYHRFLAPYHGRYEHGARRNRFFPALGNHDLNTGGGRAFFDYFSLPGNERYYDVVAGPAHFFALNSDPREPDGTAAGSGQRRWLRRRLHESSAPWRLVYFHHPPYSSGIKRNPGAWMRWPFAAWGADVVLAGHEHFYERLEVDGITHIVVGLGGADIYAVGTEAAAGSRIQFNRDHGALLGVVTPTRLSLTFTTRAGVIVDRHEVRGP